MERIVVLNDSVLQGSLNNHCSNTPDTSDVKLNIYVGNLRIHENEV